MKSSESASKKVELRDRILEYARTHAVNDRIPTVAEFRKALGVTNYMLLACMNELIKEGQFYRKSRKEGTFLSVHKRKYVIGLFNVAGDERGFVDYPAWMSGFFRVFTRNAECLLRLLPRTSPENIPDVMRQYGLDSMVWCESGGQMPVRTLGALPEPVRNRLIYAYLNTGNLPIRMPKVNAIGMDHDYWAREYVRAAVRRGCRNILHVSPPNRIHEIMLDEMKKRKLPWRDEWLISDPADLPKKLPKLIRKYKFDAVHCAGGMQHSFALAVRDLPDFRPLLPVFGFENMYLQMKRDYPWLNAFFPFEHLDDFFERFGSLAGKAALELAETGKPFPSVALKLESEKRNVVRKV